MNVCFFTVTCRKDYDVLLGSIDHHARMGRHVVLDTSPDPLRFRNLPPSVRWIHEPTYGSGWANFKLRSAVERAQQLAKESGAEILVYLDSDEFYSADAGERLFPLALEAALDLPVLHWGRDRIPRLFGASEWHPRVWPSWANVTILQNEAWKVHPNYNGNPEHHAVVALPADLPVLRVPGLFRNHLHYAVGEKAVDDEVARQTIDGWPDKGAVVPKVALPPKIELWMKRGILPSEAFK